MSALHDRYFWLGFCACVPVTTLLFFAGAAISMHISTRRDERKARAHAEKLARCLTDGREKP